MHDKSFRLRLAPLFAIAYLIFPLPALAGAYDDILVAAQNDETAKVVEFLQRGLDVNTAAPSGDTLTIIAARNGNNELLDFLLANRANILKRNRYGDSALMVAAMQGNAGTVKRLLAAGADIPSGGWNALHYAAYSGHTEVIRMLVERKPDLDAPAPNGQTALMLASGKGYLDIVRLLVDADADMDAEDPTGQTALSLAEKNQHADIAAYLRNEGALK